MDHRLVATLAAGVTAMFVVSQSLQATDDKKITVEEAARMNQHLKKLHKHIDQIGAASDLRTERTKEELDCEHRLNWYTHLTRLMLERWIALVDISRRMINPSDEAVIVQQISKDGVHLEAQLKTNGVDATFVMNACSRSADIHARANVFKTLSKGAYEDLGQLLNRLGR